MNIKTRNLLNISMIFATLMFSCERIGPVSLTKDLTEYPAECSEESLGKEEALLLEEATTLQKEVSALKTDLEALTDPSQQEPSPQEEADYSNANEGSEDFHLAAAPRPLEVLQEQLEDYKRQKAELAKKILDLQALNSKKDKTEQEKSDIQDKIVKFLAEQAKLSDRIEELLVELQKQLKACQRELAEIRYKINLRDEEFEKKLNKILENLVKVNAPKWGFSFETYKQMLVGAEVTSSRKKLPSASFGLTLGIPYIIEIDGKKTYDVEVETIIGTYTYLQTSKGQSFFKEISAGLKESAPEIENSLAEQPKVFCNLKLGVTNLEKISPHLKFTGGPGMFTMMTSGVDVEKEIMEISISTSPFVVQKNSPMSLAQAVDYCEKVWLRKPDRAYNDEGEELEPSQETLKDFLKSDLKRLVESNYRYHPDGLSLCQKDQECENLPNKNTKEVFQCVVPKYAKIGKCQRLILPGELCTLEDNSALGSYLGRCAKGTTCRVLDPSSSRPTDQRYCVLNADAPDSLLSLYGAKAGEDIVDGITFSYILCYGKSISAQGASRCEERAKKHGSLSATQQEVFEDGCRKHLVDFCAKR